jgi:hypothetical protein
MYKISSDKKQTALHRGKITDWMNGKENLSIKDQFELMKRGIQIFESRLLRETDKEERKRLGLEKLALQNELTKFRKLNRIEQDSRDGLAGAFIRVAKEMLGKTQYELILRAAERELAKIKSEELKEKEILSQSQNHDVAI